MSQAEDWGITVNWVTLLGPRGTGSPSTELKISEFPA